MQAKGVMMGRLKQLGRDRGPPGDVWVAGIESPREQSPNHGSSDCPPSQPATPTALKFFFSNCACQLGWEGLLRDQEKEERSAGGSLQDGAAMRPWAVGSTFPSCWLAHHSMPDVAAATEPNRQPWTLWC